MAVTQLARRFTVSTIRQPRSLNWLFWFSKVPHIRACSISNCKLKVADRQHWWASFGISAREGKVKSKDMVSVATTSAVELKSHVCLYLSKYRMRVKKLATSQFRKLLFQSGLSKKPVKWTWFFILEQIKLNRGTWPRFESEGFWNWEMAYRPLASCPG